MYSLHEQKEETKFDFCSEIRIFEESRIYRALFCSNEKIRYRVSDE